MVVDVLRAFTTAAYAFGAGATHIYLVDEVGDALQFKAANPGTLAMGEDHGRKPAGFDFSNSPVDIATADVDGREIVQRTSAGTRGVVAARAATRIWCASLVCASATAVAVRSSGLGPPTYVISGRFPDVPEISGSDDLATAKLIERARIGEALDAEGTSHEVATSDEADRTLALGPGHVHPDDIAYATQVDRFAFAMEVERLAQGLLRLRALIP